MAAFLRRVEKGVKLAVVTGGFLAAWTGLLRVFAGEAPFRDLGTTYGRVALTYVVGGAAAGAVAGALAPLARFRVGGPLVGFVAALPVAALAAYLDTGRLPWRTPGGQNFLIAAVGIGVLLGAWFPGKAREIDARAAAARAARGEPPA